MPSLTVKGIPERLLDRLRRRAADHRRSLNAEVIECLERAAGTKPLDPEEFLSRVDELRRRAPVRPLSDAAIRRAKRSGRP